MTVLSTESMVWVRWPFLVPLVLSVGPEGAFLDWGAWSRRVVVGKG